MERQGWVATGVIEAPLDKVVDVLLRVREGPVEEGNAHLLLAEYRFARHPKGTLLTYEAINVAPGEHRRRLGVRFQFWLGGKLKIGLRGGLRRMGRLLGSRAYPGR